MYYSYGKWLVMQRVRVEFQSESEPDWYDTSYSTMVAQSLTLSCLIVHQHVLLGIRIHVLVHVQCVFYVCIMFRLICMTSQCH